VRDRLLRLIAIADDPQDDDGERLRKRVGVIAGYVTVIAPLSVPLQARWNPVAIGLGLALSLWAIGDLVLLRRTRRFER
jgi:hypothetical protein